jgi:hypothetical protein
MTTPIRANAAADMHSMTNANDSVRMKRKCILFPLLSIPRLPGIALLLRVAWIELRDVQPILLCSGKGNSFVP